MGYYFDQLYALAAEKDIDPLAIAHAVIEGCTVTGLPTERIAEALWRAIARDGEEYVRNGYSDRGEIH